MNWTKEPPTEEGWYWVIQTSSPDPPEIHRFEKRYGDWWEWDPDCIDFYHQEREYDKWPRLPTLLRSTLKAYPPPLDQQ
jgi:hypothetical protein